VTDIFKPKRYTLERMGATYELEENPAGELVAWVDYEFLLNELQAEQGRYIDKGRVATTRMDDK